MAEFKRKCSNKARQLWTILACMRVRWRWSCPRWMSWSWSPWWAPQRRSRWCCPLISLFRYGRIYFVSFYSRLYLILLAGLWGRIAVERLATFSATTITKDLRALTSLQQKHKALEHEKVRNVRTSTFNLNVLSPFSRPAPGLGEGGARQVGHAEGGGCQRGEWHQSMQQNGQDHKSRYVDSWLISPPPHLPVIC